MKRIGMGVVVWLWAGAATAQVVFEGPSPAQQCLVTSGPTVKPLVYPEVAYKRKDQGTVSVRLTFTAPDESPDYKLLSDHTTTPLELLDAVRTHVRQFRVPCLKPGAAPVVLHQDYVFTPNDGRKVVASDPELRGADGERPYQSSCTLNAADSVPNYPQRLQRKDIWGPVLVNLHFAGPKDAPKIEMLSSPDSGLGSSVVSAASQLRLRCTAEPVAEEFPKTLGVIYQFRLIDRPVAVLNDTDLVNLVRNGRDYATPVYFDTAQMGCPFDVRLTYKRPYDLNFVEELEQAHPGRKPLLDWLKRLTLRLSEKTSRLVVGDTMTVSIPCTTVDL